MQHIYTFRTGVSSKSLYSNATKYEIPLKFTTHPKHVLRAKFVSWHAKGSVVCTNLCLNND